MCQNISITKQIKMWDRQAEHTGALLAMILWDIKGYKLTSPLRTLAPSCTN